ncbi:MAG: 23S rRNA (uracil(1939)-C(5))-methyltransferase RlmD [Deltaproteobacteria bacterium]|uniref:23S rRNA (Uracil(1939)-C(5))-methyltransferase RlmD n=1 Tax=Candidatus Zymogenus saltonus TaxID=2844893 RepID=A0A9D8KEF5_9DELT|nr:23S rRNA (uracil(1939)-C(5))-methyltransferase RlmD [Candidatus Zymogenus saltonus]
MVNKGTATIESLAYGGNGVARHKGKVLFIPYTAPGDVVFFELTSERKNFSFARALEILTPSEERVNPVCPLFTRCGGCQWQHVGYERQLLEKKSIVRESLLRIAGVAGVDFTVDNIVKSPGEYGYRARVDLNFKVVGGEKRRSIIVGHLAPRSREIVPLQACPVLRPEIDKRLQGLPDALGRLGVRSGGELKLVSGEGGEVAAVVYVQGSFGGDRSGVGKFAESLELKGAVVILKKDVKRGALVSGNPTVHYSVPAGGIDRKLKLSAGGFLQGNPAVNRLLISRLTKFDFSNMKVLELYSGAGNLSIPVGLSGAELLGVEENRYSVMDAQKNAGLFGLAGVKFLKGDAADSLNNLLRNAKGGGKFDAVILNPPREGARDAIDGIVDLRPAHIFYISCAPPTLSRDVGELIKAGYRVREAIPFDMFPQTYHVETLCHLSI